MEVRESDEESSSSETKRPAKAKKRASVAMGFAIVSASDEYSKVVTGGVGNCVAVGLVGEAPDGSEGFYFGHLTSNNIDRRREEGEEPTPAHAGAPRAREVVGLDIKGDVIGKLKSFHDAYPNNIKGTAITCCVLSDEEGGAFLKFEYDVEDHLLGFLGSCGITHAELKFDQRDASKDKGSASVTFYPKTGELTCPAPKVKPQPKKQTYEPRNKSRLQKLWGGTKKVVGVFMDASTKGF
jgi:hypothetical protein